MAVVGREEGGEPRQALGQVVDRESLSSAGGTRARMRLEVPASWEAGDALSIVVPQRLVCAHCDGGGCDACDRSGALRFAGDVEARTIEVQLPPLGPGGAALRLSRPFGQDEIPEQLILQLAPAPPDSPFPAGVTRTPGRPALPATTTSPGRLLAAAGATAAIATVAAIIVTSC